MLKIIRRRLSVPLTPPEALQVQESLQARFNSLLHGVRLEYLRRLGLDMLAPEAYRATAPPEHDTLLAGEIFVPEPGTLLYLKIFRSGEGLEAGAISGQWDRDFASFFEEVRSAVLMLRDKAQVGPWKSLESAPPGGPPEGDPEGLRAVSPRRRLEAARELNDRASRELMEWALPAGPEFFEQMPPEERADVLARLERTEELGLTARSYAVLCCRTGQTVFRAAQRETIDEVVRRGLECPMGACPLSRGTLREEVVCTELGHQMLRDNRWLQFLVEGTLLSLGARPDQIARYGEGGPLVQILVAFNHQRHLVVLANRSLTPEACSAISARVAAHRVDGVVLVAARPLSPIVRHHLAQANPRVAFEIIEGVEGVDVRLEEILRQRQLAFIGDLLRPLSALTPVRLEDLVARQMSRWLYPSAPVGPDPSPPATAELTAVSTEKPPVRRRGPRKRRRQAADVISVPRRGTAG